MGDLATAEVGTARRVGTPLWVNARTILGLLLFGLAFLSGQRLLAGAAETTPVWAAARDLPEGTKISALHLKEVQVRMPSDLLGRYATSSAELAGGVLLAPVHAGELIANDWVGTGPEAVAGRSLTIPVSPEHAVGGRLRSGDTIDVYATFDSGDTRARTTAVVRGIQVLGTVDAGGLITGEEATVGVTVAVTPDQAARLAFAVRAAEIDIARVEGPARPLRAQSINAGTFP